MKSLNKASAIKMAYTISETLFGEKSLINEQDTSSDLIYRQAGIWGDSASDLGDTKVGAYANGVTEEDNNEARSICPPSHNPKYLRNHPLQNSQRQMTYAVTTVTWIEFWVNNEQNDMTSPVI